MFTNMKDLLALVREVSAFLSANPTVVADVAAIVAEVKTLVAHFKGQPA